MLGAVQIFMVIRTYHPYYTDNLVQDNQQSSVITYNEERNMNIVIDGVTTIESCVKQMDDPLVLDLPPPNKHAIVGSAILAPSGNLIFFIVKDDPHVQPDELPDGFRCAFGNTPHDADVVTTPIYVYAVKLRFYGSSDIWACSKPRDGKAYEHVTMLPPSTVKTQFGTGLFRIEAPNSKKTVGELSGVPSLFT